MTSEPSVRAKEVLKLLARHHNVLISGAPATGKSLLMYEVAHWFKTSLPRTPTVNPEATDGAVLPSGLSAGSLDWLPGEKKENRRTWSITFHQGTKYRDFIVGLVPALTPGSGGFVRSKGVMLEAAEHALKEDGASLLVIDEINRGPAVAIFGDAISAIETDKRLAPGGEMQVSTAPLRILQDDGSVGEFCLPHDLYLLASMNEADTSVEPLDVAFRRRWHSYRLEPDATVLCRKLGLDENQMVALKTTPETPADVFETAIRAWAKMNEKIALGRGEEFKIGHGIFLYGVDVEGAKNDLGKARELAREVWLRLFAHALEVFVGDRRAAAEVINANIAESPYELEEGFFADTPTYRLLEPDINADSAYQALLAASRS